MALTIDKSIRAKYYGSTRAASKIKYLIYHYTANSGTTATAKANANYFKNITRQASAHYVVDKKNIAYNCVPDLNTAWSVGDSGKGTMKNKITNSNSISIELVSQSYVSSPALGKDQYYIPEETLANGIELGILLMKKYNIPITNVYRHYDVTAKRCPDPMCYTSKGEAQWKAYKNRIEAALNVKIEEDDEVVEPIKINLLGADKNINGIFKEGSNYLSCNAFKEMGLTVTSSGSKPVVNVGKVKVNVNGKVKEIDGFNGNGTNYCSIRQIAEALGLEVGWENGAVVIK